MQIGMIGLGRMGGNIVRRLSRRGHECVVFDRDPSAVATLATDAAKGAETLDRLVAALKPPRIIWVMLPAGDPTEATVLKLTDLLSKGDVIIDGGNSFWKDDIRRARAVGEKGLHYLDVGTSGGVWGLERGYCLMIGGETPVVERLDPIFAALAPGVGEIPRTPHRKAETNGRNEDTCTLARMAPDISSR
jgi:6-phosphogluconate dehydrogenase